MRSIEKKIIHAFVNGETRNLSKRDRTEVVNLNGDIEYTLWDTAVAEKIGKHLRLGCYNYLGNTTKSRINVFSQHYHLPSVYQKDWCWYWSDGVGYSGPRVFDIKD